MTSDERREVARKLHNIGDWFDEIAPTYVDIRDAGMVINDAIGTANSNDDSWAEFFWHLADLMDPTCHIALDDLASQQCMGPMLSCDRCGAAFPSINEDYNYCPHCGARVIGGDEVRRDGRKESVGEARG